MRAHIAAHRHRRAAGHQAGFAQNRHAIDPFPFLDFVNFPIEDIFSPDELRRDGQHGGAPERAS
ncbi:MAG: hypothetical protein ACOYJ6_01350 [Caulobacterales bacterium]